MLSSSDFWSIDFIHKILLAMPNVCFAAVFGLLTFRIAREQKNIQKEKIISDLFDRRFSVYVSVRKCLENIVIDNDTELLKENIRIAVESRNTSLFLFENTTHKKIERIIDDFIKYLFFMGVSNEVLSASKVNKSKFEINKEIESSRIYMECAELLNGDLGEIFHPYLSVRDFRNDRRGILGKLLGRLRH